MLERLCARSATTRPLQDTNDYYLANMQKDGTYSVVPRVPGGEITAEKLIALGEVARKFGLYTKITGGQRIDLFGAQVHQLPSHLDRLDRSRLRVWAGLRQGAAHREVLRRLDVVSFRRAGQCRPRHRNREPSYRGLRAPHKIKLGVSGCTRECAEAQSKDVGVIATGIRDGTFTSAATVGIKPRHAELLAADLDKDTIDTLHRPVPHVLHSHGRPSANAPRPGATTSRAAWSICKQVVCRE